MKDFILFCRPEVSFSPLVKVKSQFFIKGIKRESYPAHTTYSINKGIVIYNLLKNKIN